MIAVLTCHCANAITKARRFLVNNGVEDWIEVPMFIGKENVGKFLSNLPQYEECPYNPQRLRSFLSDVSRFIVVFGYNDEICQWADIEHGDTQQIADAELILKRFA